MVAKLLSIPERKIRKVIKELGIQLESEYDFEEFEMFFFLAFND